MGTVPSTSDNQPFSHKSSLNTWLCCHFVLEKNVLSRQRNCQKVSFWANHFDKSLPFLQTDHSSELRYWFWQADFSTHLSPLAVVLVWVNLHNPTWQRWILPAGPGPLSCYGQREEDHLDPPGETGLRLSFLWQCFPPECQLPPFPGFPW